ncbi:MAG: alpha,alpha-trehalase TreF [Bacteroidetes bacterium]|nr:alpha,alpha-trehalase TreF [Bacteroidota bacterium]MBS1541968.1 alpha,alpha-trehalase TreF [Bacteroidota bacterium]
MNHLLGDGKIFPDSLPKRSLNEICNEFLVKKNDHSFNLNQFISENFDLPSPGLDNYRPDRTVSIEAHISSLWDMLTRKPDKAIPGCSLIPLPYPYVVPGGRFREIYYWDSYFTMLGLRESGRTDLIQHMVNNFAYLIDTIGYIPNGNRTYFLGRSQPPFFSLMIEMLQNLQEVLPSSNEEEVEPLVRYLPQLEKEHQFWMRGIDELHEPNTALHRVVKLSDGSVLNRYWDENNTPRPEAFQEDVMLSRQSKQKPEVLFRHLRAAAESGWDFSSRWFKDETFASIHTTDIIPVDLNCLLYHLETTLANIYLRSGNQMKSRHFLMCANQRKAAIKKYCWSDDRHFFFDYDFVEQTPKKHYTLAAAFPLFFELASPEQALAVEQILKHDFLKPGGMTTTLQASGQQWDAPNGWAPLQWVSYQGLLNYGLEDTAHNLKHNWLSIIQKFYLQTSRLTEKYNVLHANEAAGGEYPNQDGFGWTNGVYLAMKNSGNGDGTR